MTEAFRPVARAPRGFVDKRAGDLRTERHIVEAVSAVYERFGFERLETGALEYADALGKFLPDADRPNEGVYALQDDDEQWMALRYDLTAPLARFSAEHWDSLPKPFRRYAVGPVWRNEKPGPGRYREFLQCDADTVGSGRPEADAEIIAMAVEGFASVGLSADQYVLKINNRKLLNGILDDADVRDAGQQLAVLRAIDKLDRLGLNGVELLLGAGRLDESGAFTKGAALPSATIDAVMSYLAMGAADSRSAFLDNVSDTAGLHGGAAALEELATIDAALNRMKISDQAARFDVSVVRGLEYYTGAVFEAELLAEVTDERGQRVRFGSVGGGGRYDDLIARFTGQITPATGFSFGVSRLATALDAIQKGRISKARGPVVVIVLDPAHMGEYFAAAAKLRASRVAAEVYLGASGMKAQMKYADRRLSPAAVILGGDEIAAGQVTVKDLDLGRALATGVEGNAEWRQERPGQVTVPRSALVATVRRITEARP